MRSLRSLCYRLACMLAAFMPFHAHAESFALGTVASPTSFSAGNSGLLGAFSDTYEFSIAPGQTFKFDSFLSTGFTTRYFIADMQAGLYGTSGLLQTGDAATITSPEGFPSRNIEFDPLALGAGSYELRIIGTATAAFPDVPITAAYHGSLSFTSVSAPIPEPETVAMLAIGLAILRFATRRGRG